MNRTTDTLGLPPVGNTIQNDQPLSTVNRLGRDLTQPVGTLTGPVTSPAQTSSSEPAPSRDAPPDEYRPNDVFYPYTPDAFPRGTLTRIYFQPGETTLDLGARNQVAGFVNAFAKRIGNVELRGYADRAGGNDAQASDIAMQRALAVQQALLEQGMSTGRVRASGMGNTDTTDAASDRVDILFDGY
ncbi:MAG: OmpA family protein [Parvibaculum sp.]|uniref:OmpA family protein n=1 Tax=Parvibaculum sp. TaxID=2024848 RepID=UPI0034A02F9F